MKNSELVLSQVAAISESVIQYLLAPYPPCQERPQKLPLFPIPEIFVFLLIGLTKHVKKLGRRDTCRIEKVCRSFRKSVVLLRQVSFGIVSLC